MKDIKQQIRDLVDKADDKNVERALNYLSSGDLLRTKKDISIFTLFKSTDRQYMKWKLLCKDEMLVYLCTYGDIQTLHRRGGPEHDFRADLGCFLYQNKLIEIALKFFSCDDFKILSRIEE